jgi:hypothetical protein
MLIAFSFMIFYQDRVLLESSLDYFYRYWFAGYISNQTRVYSILPDARNRMNTVFMSFSFLGTAAGSAFGLFLWRLGAGM